MKSGVKSTWLQKNPNVISEVPTEKIGAYVKKISNKRDKKGIGCPTCPNK